MLDLCLLLSSAAACRRSAPPAAASRTNQALLSQWAGNVCKQKRWWSLLARPASRRAVARWRQTDTAACRWRAQLCSLRGQARQTAHALCSSISPRPGNDKCSRPGAAYPYRGSLRGAQHRVVWTQRQLGWAAATGSGSARWALAARADLPRSKKSKADDGQSYLARGAEDASRPPESVGRGFPRWGAAWAAARRREGLASGRAPRRGMRF